MSRLGMHHFAHLRALAEGIDPKESAFRYLGIEHGHEAVTASRQTIDAVRAVARTHALGSAWRLIGLTIRHRNFVAIGLLPNAQRVSTLANVPTLDDYIAERDLDGWSEDEVLQMYAEAYPADLSENKRIARREKLRQRQLVLLNKLEALSVEQPDRSHPVIGWFDEHTAKKMVTAGLITLGHIQDAIRTAGRWYKTLPGIGKGKATRIASFLESIIATPSSWSKPAFLLEVASSPYTTFRELTGDAQRPSGLDKSPGILRATSDLEAVRSWVAARAGSTKTATIYMREAIRLLLWLQKTRTSYKFEGMMLEDCLGYMAFLQAIPPDWISRKNAALFSVGWAPFRGQLSQDSYKQSIVIIASLFLWLLSAGYLKSNPWVLVNKKTGSDDSVVMKKSKSISEFGFDQIINYIDAQPKTAASERARFIFTFLEAVGLRSNEFLNARLEHFEQQVEGWFLAVHGKGSKNRLVYVGNQALGAVQRYLEYRGVGLISNANPELPLVSSALHPTEPVGYQAFYESVRSWTVRAIRASSLPTKERLYLEQASPHWLRHTFGARAVARDVAMDAIQAQMGHASIKTTMDIYGRAPLKRRASEIAKAFG